MDAGPCLPCDQVRIWAQYDANFNRTSNVSIYLSASATAATNFTDAMASAALCAANLTATAKGSFLNATCSSTMANVQYVTLTRLEANAVLGVGEIMVMRAGAYVDASMHDMACSASQAAPSGPHPGNAGKATAGQGTRVEKRAGPPDYPG